MLPSGIYTGEVLTVNPLEYSAEIKISQSYGVNNVMPITATPLNIHGGYSGSSVGVSMPEVGSIVMVLVPTGTSDSIAYIIGHVKEASSRVARDSHVSSIDPISDLLEPSGFFRGGGPSDILPGDFVIKSSSGSRLDVDSSGRAAISSGDAEISVASVAGRTYTRSVANELSAKYDMFSLEASKDSLNLSANVSDSNSRNSYLTDNNIKNDMAISLGGDSALSISYTGSSPALFSISKNGEIIIRGRKVIIDQEGSVTNLNGIESITGDKGFDVSGTFSVSAGDVILKSSSNISMQSSGSSSISSGADITAYSSNMLTLRSGGPSLIKQGPTALIPGLNDGAFLRCDSGSVVVKSGSILPGVSTLAKPQIRLESDSGGDIVIQSASTPGGALATGSIVLSSPLPASVTGAGGLGNYGIVLNSPLCMLGNYPGIELTPPNLPNAFMPPIPIIGNEPVAKAVPLLTALAALAAALTAHPPTIPVGTAFSAALGIATPLIPTRNVFAI